MDVQRVVITPYDLQALGVWKRERAQQHGIYDAEDGGAGADSQRKRDHHHRRKPRLLKQTSESVTQIVQ